MKNQIKRVTATQAARHFSRLLDRIEAGDEFVVRRRSEVVARIGPVSGVPRKISECIAVPLKRSSARPDPDFLHDLLEIIEFHS